MAARFCQQLLITFLVYEDNYKFVEIIGQKPLMAILSHSIRKIMYMQLDIEQNDLGCYYHLCIYA